VTLPRAARARAGDESGRERVLGAALRLFAKKGYAATTVRDILRAAGVTAPVLYYHFGNKEGVFLALVRDGLKERDAKLAQGIGHGETPEERIRAFCRATAGVRREHGDLGRIVEGVAAGPPGAAPHFDVTGIVARTVATLEGFVREGIRARAFRKCAPRPVALALMGAIDVASRPHVFGSVTATRKDPLDGMLDVILDGIRPPNRR
jgi:AcrR family transcriptional regulator